MTAPHTFAGKLRNVLAAAKLSAPAGTWTAERWEQVVNEFADLERPLGKDGKAKKPKRQTPINKMTDEEFMDYLRSEPTLAGIDIPREIGKCRFHFKSKQGIDPSRMRIINWLGRADKTLSEHGRDAGTRASDAAERSLPIPHGWQEFMKEKQRGWLRDNPRASEAPGTYAIEKGDFFGMPRTWRDECRRALGQDGQLL